MADLLIMNGICIPSAACLGSLGATIVVWDFFPRIARGSKCRMTLLSNICTIAQVDKNLRDLKEGRSRRDNVFTEKALWLFSVEMILNTFFLTVAEAGILY